MGSCMSGAENRPIMRAARAGKADVVKALLEPNPSEAWYADPVTGLTPLHVAATAASLVPEEQYLAVIRALITAKADVDARDNITGMTPLLYAIRAQKSKLVHSLVEQNADVRVEDVRRWTALHFAVGEGSFSAQETRERLGPADSTILRIILKAKASVDVQNDTLSTALHLACRHEKAHLIQILLQEEFKARPNLQDLNKDSPLHLAVTMTDKPNGIKALLDRQADVNIINTRRQTPLHIAVLNNNEYAVQALLQKGVDINIRDVTGMSALDYATAKSFAYIESLLAKAAKDPARKALGQMSGALSPSLGGMPVPISLGGNMGQLGTPTSQDLTRRQSAITLNDVRLATASSALEPSANRATSPTNLSSTLKKGIVSPRNSGINATLSGGGGGEEPSTPSIGPQPKVKKGVKFADDL